MNNNIERFIVLTGGPGSGKSTLLDRLEQAGYVRSDEAGRGIIQHQVAIGGHALPWCDPAAFAEQMLAWDMRSYQLAQNKSGPVFFDRGVPDVVGYLQLVGLPVPAHMESAVEIFRYNPRVFITPPWPEIFCQDNERMQSYAEAVRTYESLVKTYLKYGYELIELPRLPVDERAQFLLSEV
ncbi:AAA family ATPase [Chitinimonas sp. BJB300]|uniref:AAA family ATPase n=1 Tax=Chitinimonas sp. BJB300 TaxID=1559339 RepID=UPI000C0D5030|nr:AAA family ATPase [Chitinimonas sp. BJB300]PHV12464.1 ATPase [Chitinimonas sp. BJB300]TSJ89147.1 AAA family ATPase [Chitinimonas sp. BJB300]